MERLHYFFLWYCPNEQHISVNLDQCPFRQSKITLVGSNFGPFKSIVVERNFGPSRITVVDRNFGPSKTMIVDRYFGHPKENYTTYINSLKFLGLETLEARRKNLTLKFAKDSLADGHFTDLIQKKQRYNGPNIRKKEYNNVTFAHTERYKNSPILTMQRLLNEDKLKNT